MNPKELEKNYQQEKKSFHAYIDKIKKNSVSDIYTIVNTTLIKNPYATNFPKQFFLKSESIEKENKIFLFIKHSIKFYLKQFYLFFSYLISFMLFKLFYKKKPIPKDAIFIDIFFLVDNIIKDKHFNENYFKELYPVLEKYQQNYIFLPRLYGVSKNPFKLVKLFKILNSDKRNFLFEFEVLSFTDFLTLFKMILLYPFKTLRLLQKELMVNDILFNQELIRDISSVGIEAFSRYLYGKNIAKINSVKKIYSWSEFQVIERSFNFGVRKTTENIELIGCQFFLNYEIYFNTYVDDIDFEMLSSPHRVLVNGDYYLLEREKVEYKRGVSLRYQSLFNFDGIEKEENVLLLGSYIEIDTLYMLKSVETFESVIFKNHPAVNLSNFGVLPSNIKLSNDNIYELFKSASLVIGTASGTCVEAVACGVSVIVMASQDNLTANPLVKYGKGEIWDIAFSKDDVEKLYNKLLKYREENRSRIMEIASWYKDNFFVEPTEENIVNAFELDIKE